jgi:hypothetical protein
MFSEASDDVYILLQTVQDRPETCRRRSILNECNGLLTTSISIEGLRLNCFLQT